MIPVLDKIPHLFQKVAQLCSDWSQAKHSSWHNVTSLPERRGKNSWPVYLETFRPAAPTTPWTNTKISPKSRNAVGWKGLRGRECGPFSRSSFRGSLVKSFVRPLLVSLLPSQPFSHRFIISFFHFSPAFCFYSPFPFEPFWNRWVRQLVLISACKESGVGWV